MGALQPIQKGQDLLYDLISKNGLGNERVYKQSCILDELILQYMKQQISDEERVPL